ncbi:MAG: aminoacyl-tRNA deacylase [Chloroflexi bacterium]|nr:aminoacyl-tRNA deacylase [Chloroflexota bacterium]
MSKKKRGPRTNTMRLLDALHVPYEVLTFSADIHSGTGVADAVGLDPSTVYKTLVVRRPQGKPLLVMVAGDETVDLGALAASVGEKKLSMAAHREAESLTGLQVGGISALALLNKGFDVCIDRAAQHLERVTVSAGQRGINLCLSVADLFRVTGARWVDATRGDPAAGEPPPS